MKIECSKQVDIKDLHPHRLSLWKTNLKISFLINLPSIFFNFSKYFFRETMIYIDKNISNPKINRMTQSLCWKVNKVVKRTNNRNKEPFPIKMSNDMWDITARKYTTLKKGLKVELNIFVNQTIVLENYHYFNLWV